MNCGTAIRNFQMDRGEKYEPLLSLGPGLLLQQSVREPAVLRPGQLPTALSAAALPAAFPRTGSDRADRTPGACRSNRPHRAHRTYRAYRAYRSRRRRH